MYFVGIDWADLHHDVAVLDQSGKQIKDFRVDHNKKGLTELTKNLLKLNFDREEFACIIETKNGLLVQHLLDEGFPVYPVNPKVVDSRRKPSGAKSDPIDARLLANIGRSDLQELHRLERDSCLLEELKLLTRDQDSLIKNSTRLVNQLISCLKEYYPVALEIFEKLAQPITLEFLKAYSTIDHAKKATVPEIASFLKDKRHPKPNEKAIEIWNKINSPQLEPSPAVRNAKSRLMLAIIAQLQPLLKEIKAYDKGIQNLFKMHSDSKLFASLPRAGERLAPRMLAEWGEDRSRYECPEVVQALAGTSPVLFQSGKYRFARKRRSCIKPFRQVMHQFAFQHISTTPWAKEYYEKKRSEGKKHHEAVRSLANIWVRIIFRMWKNKIVYNEAIFLNSKAAHVRAA